MSSLYPLMKEDINNKNYEAERREDCTGEENTKLIKFRTKQLAFKNQWKNYQLKYTKMILTSTTLLKLKLETISSKEAENEHETENFFSR